MITHPRRGQRYSTYAHQVVTQGEYERLEPGVYPELGEDARDVVALGRNAYTQPLGYLGAVEALGERLQHLPLSRGKLGYSLARLVLVLPARAGETEQLHYLLRREQRLTRPDTSHGIYDLVQFDRLVQDARGSALDRPCRLRMIEARAQDERHSARVGVAKVFDQLPAVAVRERQVDYSDVYRLRPEHPVRLGQRVCLCHHVKTRLSLEYGGYGLPERGVVLDEHNPGFFGCLHVSIEVYLKTHPRALVWLAPDLQASPQRA